MFDLNEVESLATKYKQRAEHSRKWIDYVKAHGLANFCLVKDPTEERRKLVYDIEESWYNGTHPLSYVEHQQLISQHKSLLKSYRDETKVNYEHLKSKTEEHHQNDIFGKESLNIAEFISHQIFAASEKCSQGLVGVSRRIISSSVDVLQSSGLTAPCTFAVIGLGSIAKGEATPYSDLEYAFIVEREENYFEKLAVDSYFRINNLGETPLKYFDVDEVKVMKVDNIAAGFRIDGLMEKAGNIPTGNGRVGSQSLTLTVEAFIDLYKRSAEAPFDKNKPGDLSDMLSSSVLIYTNEGETSQLYADFLQARMAYELSNEHLDAICSKRFTSFAADVNAYNFLPEFIKFQPPNNMNIQIKTEIFRYPTLLANNIKVLLRFDTQYSWESFSYLHKQGLLSDVSYRCLKVVLALSIYMRTSAYLSYGSQAECMSLIPTIESSAVSKYNISSAIFILYGCLLVSIKKSVTFLLEQGTPDTSSIGDIVASLFSNINVNNSSFLDRAEVCYFAGQYDMAKTELTKPLDTSLESLSCKQFLNISRLFLENDKSIAKLAELCCYVLYYTKSYAAADSYFQWLLSNAPNREDKALLTLLAAHCKKELDDYQASQQLVVEAKSILEQHYLGLRVTDVSHADAVASCINIGIVYHEMGDYKVALKYFMKASCMCSTLYGDTTNHPHIASSYNGAGNACSELGNFTLAIKYYTKSLGIRKAIYGDTTNHPDIATSYNNIGVAYRRLGNNTLAIEYYTKSLDMMKAIYGDTTNHPHIADSYNNISIACSGLGNNTLAIENYAKSLDMYKAIYGDTTNHPDIANSYNNIAYAYRGLGNNTLAIEYYDKSLDMYKALYGDTTNYPNIAYGYNNIGIAYSDLGNNALAIEFCTKSLDMKKAIYGDTTNHPNIAISYNSIGDAHRRLGNITLAIEYYTKSLNMKKAAYSGTTNHPDIADSYNNIGIAYNDVGNNTLAMEYYAKSLDMRKAIYGDTTNHPDIASSYNNIGAVYSDSGNNTLALEYYTKSLEIRKAIYGDTTNHPHIASSYNNIGNACGGLGNSTLALEYYTNSLDMYKAIYGDDTNHPDIASNYNNIGNAYGDLGNNTLALEYYTKSLHMRKAIYGDTTNHPDIASSYNNIGDAYSGLGNNTLALEYFTKAGTMCAKINGGRSRQSRGSSSVQ